jgi:hypothetical protein
MMVSILQPCLLIKQMPDDPLERGEGTPIGCRVVACHLSGCVCRGVLYEHLIGYGHGAT